jgi:uncharacterized membrane protein YgdD (TMEM256/DUF423 family)
VDEASWRRGGAWIASLLRSSQSGTIKPRWILLSGALLAGLGVACGAFGAHALRARLDPVQLGWWNTAVQYQMWHALALVALAGLPLHGRALPASLLASGAIIFAGTLYLMALTDMRWLGAVTPVGGLLMIAGWAILAWRAWRAWRQPQA